MKEKKKGKQGSRLLSALLVLLFLAGVCLLLYPTVADQWNRIHQSHAISQYAERVAAIGNEEYERILNSAREYNQMIAEQGTRWSMTEEESQAYEAELNVDGSGVMGYIEIEKIKCYLAIYHGTDETVLQTSVGHLSGTSLPVGGTTSHCVLSGHRGLPSAKLFTDLDKMALGDTFVIRTLDEVLTYEVDQILIVEPSDLTALTLEQGQDYCTLVTCTPYGVNSHRMLVRGHRVENAKTASNIRITANAVQIEPILVAECIAVPVLVILILIVYLRAGFRKRKGNKKE